MSEYPKLLFKDGQEITVGGAAEEAEKCAEGWRPHGGTVEPLELPEETLGTVTLVDGEVVDDHAPTFGPPGDATHTRRKPKK